jgi:hypothetical protein
MGNALIVAEQVDGCGPLMRHLGFGRWQDWRRMRKVFSCASVPYCFELHESPILLACLFSHFRVLE